MPSLVLNELSCPYPERYRSMSACRGISAVLTTAPAFTTASAMPLFRYPLPRRDGCMP